MKIEIESDMKGGPRTPGEVPKRPSWEDKGRRKKSVPKPDRTV